MTGINIFSEIGRLRKVMLHRPGAELLNLVPELLQDLLFDDIPHLKIAQEEHDTFARVLKDKGVDVVYLTDLLGDILEGDIKAEFIREFLSHDLPKEDYNYTPVNEYFQGFEGRHLADLCIRGVKKKDLDLPPRLANIMVNGYPFVVPPLPNTYFTRDPSASIGNGICISSMLMPVRKKESLFMHYLVERHPDFADVPVHFDRSYPFSIEGGDILVPSDELVIVGISERTSPQGIEHLAHKLFEHGFKKVLAVEIAKRHASMHLDTVFSMVDYDTFTVYPETEAMIDRGNMHIYVLEKNGDQVRISQKESPFQKTLAALLGLDAVRFIYCGNAEFVASHREQWNDGSNALAIAPGEIIVYDRNNVINEELDKQGVKVVEIRSSELSRGRGGPRCMSMPLYRAGV